MSVRLAAALAAAFALAAGCGGGSATSTVPPPAPAPPPAPPPAPAPAPSPAPAPEPGLSLWTGHIGGEGNLDGERTDARLDTPPQLAVDAAGDVFAIAPKLTSKYIRKITPGGAVQTIAGGPRSNFSSLNDIAVANDGTVYVAEAFGISRVGADGSRELVIDNVPAIRDWRIAVDSTGALIAADAVYGFVVKWTLQGAVNVYGRGDLSSTDVYGKVRDIAVDAHDNIYLIVGIPDAANPFGGPVTHVVIRRIATDGTVTDLAGSDLGAAIDGPGALARFADPTSLAVDADGTVWLVDNGAIRRVTPDGAVLTLSTYGASPWGEQGYAATSIALSGANLVVGSRASVWRVDKSSRKATLLAGLPPEATRVDGPAAVARFDTTGPLSRDTDSSAVMAVLDNQGLAMRRIGIDGSVATTLVPGFAFPKPAAGGALALAGFGIGADASRFVIAKSGQYYDYSAGAWITYGGSAVYRLDVNGQPVAWAGNGEPGDVDGTGTAARLGTSLTGPAFGADGTMYIGDGRAVKKISSDARVTTMSCNACPADGFDFSGVLGLAVDGADVLVACGSSSIHRVAADGTVAYVAGQPSNTPWTLVPRDGTGTEAQFSAWTDVVPMTVGADGNLYLSDEYTVRRVSRGGVVTTVAGVAGQEGNRPGPLPGRLYRAAGIVTLGDGSLAISSGYAVMRLTVP